MRKSNTILFFCIFFLIILSTLSAAKIGNADIIKKGWFIEYSTDDNYFVYFDDIGSRATEICLLHKTATNMGEIPVDKPLINKNQEEISILHPQMKKIDKVNYFGYCVQNIHRTYLKFGEQSTVVVYQDENKLVYDCGDNKQMNVTLYKNVSDSWELSGSIWVYNYENSCKFGANDSENNGTEMYKYEVIFTIPYELDSEYNKVYVYDWENRIINIIHFDDICLNSSFGCEYNEIDEYKLEVIFDSDSFIDPFIQVTPIASNSISLTSLGENIIVLGRTFNGNANFSMYYTNGTLISHQNIDSGLGANARIEVEARNETSFVAYWYDDVMKYSYYQFFNELGQNTTGIIQHEQIGGTAPDFSIMFRDSGIEDLMYIGYMNDVSNNFDLDIINLTNYTEQEYLIDADARPEDVLSNLVSCGFANSTLIACSYYDDESDDSTLILWDVQSKAIWQTIDLDDNIGNAGQVTNAVSDSAIATLFLDDAEGVMKLSIRNFNGINLTSLLTIDPVSDSPSRVSISSVYSTIYSQYLFVPVWWDSTNGVIEAGVYFKNGTKLYNYTLSAFPNPTYPLFDTFGYNDYLDNGLNEGTYAFSFVNSTGNTLLNIYYLNGTESRIITIDYIPPNYTDLYPLNETYTNETAINFSLNATDNVELDNGTLYIYNETGGLINVSEQDLTGTQSIFSRVYNFIVDGIYTWFIRIYDTAGNFVDTVLRTIVIDTSSPDMSYEYPTLANGTQTPLNFIEVNVSAEDLNLSYIEIEFYQNYTLNQTINSSSSPLYYKFENLTDNTKYQFNASACDVNNYCTILAMREIIVNSSITGSITFYIELEQYPYLDLNVSYTFDGILELLGNPIIDSNVSIIIFKGSQNWTYPMIYNSGTGTYQVDLSFTESGAYSFNATSIHPTYGLNSIIGIFYVEEPYYVTFRIFEVKDKDLDPYENDFSYLVVYPQDPQGYYDDNLEDFMIPLFFRQTFNESVFHSEYEDGEAIVKIWGDANNYNARLIDGIITFESDYSPPRVQDSYGLNMYLGNFTFDEQNQTYEIYIDERDKYPYRWLLNVGIIIAVLLCIIAAVFIFFMIPQFPMISVVIGLVFPVMLIVFRLLFWVWKGW